MPPRGHLAALAGQTSEGEGRSPFVQRTTSYLTWVEGSSLEWQSRGGIELGPPETPLLEVAELLATDFPFFPASSRALTMARSMFPTELSAREQSKDQYLRKQNKHKLNQQQMGAPP